jgi:hypothetical protein
MLKQTLRPLGQKQCGLGWIAAWVLLCVGTAVPARASLTVLIGEPYGNFGTMMPVGHTAVYLDRVCADGPLKLRMCREGERAGVVVARYHAIGPYDWLATPVLEFLYAVERPSDVPKYVTADQVWEMRQTYRRRYLRDIVPDGAERNGKVSEWGESVGAAYDRRLWGYQMATTEEQDERFVAMMNERANKHLYHLRKTNCANFAAEVVNVYFPGAVLRGDHIADFGPMTPKQVARSVAAYGELHPEAGLRVLEIAQVPGTLRRSRPVRGAAEGLLKTKRYLATLLIIQPELPVALTALYLAHGRWDISKGATLTQPSDWAHGTEGGGGSVLTAAQ